MHANAPSRAKTLIATFLAGFFAFFLGAALDYTLRRHGTTRFSVIFDDLLVAVLFGLLVLFYEERRRRAIIEKLRTIELMNHHVRNALQIITYAQYTPDQEKQVQVVRESVARIEWALEEVLPRGEEPPLPKASGSWNP